MASTAQVPYSFLLSNQNGSRLSRKEQQLVITRRDRTRNKRNSNGGFSVLASNSTGPSKGQRALPGVDTRIHWDNPDEDWIGGSSSTSTNSDAEEKNNLLGLKFADLLNDASGSHYQ